MPPAFHMLSLPLLHKNLGHPLPSALRHIPTFWPGLGLPDDSDQATMWKANDFPFSPKEAEACLKDIQSMGEAALSGVPLQAFMSVQSTRKELKNTEEQEALENFIQTGEQSAPVPQISIHQRRQAQKFILWAWLMEKHLLEVQELTENYSLSVAQLTSVLEAEKDADLSGLELIQTLLSSNTFALPPWKLVLENMSLFLPKESTVIINHSEMIEHMMEERDMHALQELSAHTKEQLGLDATCFGFQCTTTIGHLIQKKLSTESSPWLEKTLHCIIIKD